MNEPTPLQLTVDEAQWHNRKTCREHPVRNTDPDGARDMDAERKPAPEVLQMVWNLLQMEAGPCICGGVAGFHIAQDPGDQSHIFCSNKRCGRVVPCGPRTIADGIDEWNNACPMCFSKIDSDTKECLRCKEAVR
jgi:hypothetical protein